MVTGDHPITAKSIARAVGIIGQGKSLMGDQRFSSLVPRLHCPVSSALCRPQADGY